MLIMSHDELLKLQRSKRRKAKRMKPLRNPADAERYFQRRLRKLWVEVLEPATERIVEAVRRGADPEELARLVQDALRLAEQSYGWEAQDIIWRWQMHTDLGTRQWVQQGLSSSLGVDISAVLDSPQVKDALALAGADAYTQITKIPREFIGQVIRAVSSNFHGQPLPDGFSNLQSYIQHIGQVSKRRARLIARDQTTKLAGALNRVRQESIGVTEYVWRTVKDNRVVGNPTGVSPVGNARHMDHYHREGKVFRWDDPPPDGHPGQAIQCRCWASPVLDKQSILAHARVG